MFPPVGVTPREVAEREVLSKAGESDVKVVASRVG